MPIGWQTKRAEEREKGNNGDMDLKVCLIVFGFVWFFKRVEGRLPTFFSGKVERAESLGIREKK